MSVLNIVKYASVMNIPKNDQKTGSDQALILRPSKGPNGSMLNAPNIELAISQRLITIPAYPCGSK